MLKLKSKSPKFKIMPVASKNYLEFEIARLNEAIGTNLVIQRSDTGYTIFTDDSRTSEINCCMKYRDVISFSTTMRSCFYSLSRITFANDPIQPKPNKNL